ncbi:MAG: Mrp/NBP35 family ATP-binding protein [Legionella sp.]|nr:Mrp/NBP35 family ATP-binding protein [Legionella sp.]
MNIKSHLTQLPGKQLRGIKNTIAIGSGKGGVGKSTVTVNLAAALTKLGARVGILDADIYGPSIPQLLGCTAAVQCEGDKYLPIQAHGIQAMSIGYLTEQSMPLIWRGPMLAKSMIQLLDATKWDDLDYLLIDLPPGTGDIQLSLVQKIPLTGAIIVTTPQTVATNDAEKALRMFQKTNIHVLGIVENMAEHICTACGHHSTLFGSGGASALASAHQCTLLGQLPLRAEIRENADNGVPSNLEAYDAIATATQLAISARPLNYADKFPPVVVE